MCREECGRRRKPNIDVAQVRPIVQKQPAVGERRPSGNGRQARYGGELRNELAVAIHDGVGKNHERIAFRFADGRERLLDFARREDREVSDVESEFGRGLLRGAALFRLARVLRARKDADALHARQRLLEELDALADERAREMGNPVKLVSGRASRFTSLASIGSPLKPNTTGTAPLEKSRMPTVANSCVTTTSGFAAMTCGTTAAKSSGYFADAKRRILRLRPSSQPALFSPACRLFR